MFGYDVCYVLAQPPRTSTVNTGMQQKQNHRVKYRSEDGCERLSQIM